MVTKASDDAPRVGEHVLVPWGVSNVPAVVTEVYGSGVLARASVEVTIRGPQGEDYGSQKFSVPLDALIRGEQQEPPAPATKAS